MDINFKDFSLNEVNAIHPFIEFVIEDYSEYDNIPERFTITDCFLIPSLSKGSENMYLDVIVYNAKDSDDMREFVLSAYTKDLQDEFKKIVIELINQA